MPKTTTNYGLTKPLYNENADVAVLNENFDALDEILTPTISASTAPTSVSKGKLAAVIGWLANRIKAITGKTNWYNDPSVTLEDCKSHFQSGVHTNATAAISEFMSAMLTAQSNTSYSTKQVRNIVIWTSGSTPPATSNGDIVVKTF